MTWSIRIVMANQSDILANCVSDESLARYEKNILESEPFILSLAKGGRDGMVRTTVNPEYIAYLRAEKENDD